MSYEKSQTAVLDYKKVGSSSKKLFETFRNERTITQPMLQMVADDLCSDFGIANVPVSFAGKQPKSGGGKTLGLLRRKISLGSKFYSITIFQYTATQMKQLSPKTALDTLLHELAHYFDFEVLKFDRSPLTAGFFKRINNLKNTLMDKPLY